jgi:hypothetical protein
LVLVLRLRFVNVNYKKNNKTVFGAWRRRTLVLLIITWFVIKLSEYQNLEVNFALV